MVRLCSGVLIDLWVPHYLAVGRMLGVNVAVTDPLAATALASSPSSADESGRAATLRAEKKVGKYEHILRAVDGVFRAGVVERFGAVGDSLAGLLRMVVGDAERMRDAEDYSFTAQRQVVWAAQHVVFASVLGDAAMLDAALERDVYSLSDEAAEAARARVRALGGRGVRGVAGPGGARARAHARARGGDGGRGGAGDA